LHPSGKYNLNFWHKYKNEFYVLKQREEFTCHGPEKSPFWVAALFSFPEILPLGVEFSWQVLRYPP
jgi:hypothetical protein